MRSKLNLGCGNHIMQSSEGEEVINHDRIAHRKEVNAVWDLNLLPWPWDDESFDRIIAESVLEHLQINLLQSLNECWRLLRSEGIIQLKIPYWKHEVSYLDPTHYWKFALHTLDFFDPDTDLGSRYSFYTERKWKILHLGLNDKSSSVKAAMEVRK